MQTISILSPEIRTVGRITTTDDYQTWVFPYTQAQFRFTGSTLAVQLRNYWNYGNIRLGAMIDGIQYRLVIPTPDEPDFPAYCTQEGELLTITIADHLPQVEHQAVIFKRQDGGMHYLDVHTILIDDDATLTAPIIPDEPRRIEIYGDSVTCGERNEAVLYAGKPDPDADLSAYSNAWYSYGAITGRNLNADVRLIAQGGAPLLDGIGWFNEPNYIGMESIWNRATYNPALGTSQPWNFDDGYAPQVVIIALGQNDSHPHDFMATQYAGKAAAFWRERYGDFIRALRSQYPDAHIICTTTIMEHDAHWDRAIAEVVANFHDPQVTYFSYSNAGTGTPGHPRIAEDAKMARELTTCIESFGAELWHPSY